MYARIVKETMRALQTHCGGEWQGETQRYAARRVSFLEAELEYLEDQFAETRAAGGEPDLIKLELYGRLSDRQRRLSEAALGWQRSSRDITPNLDQYLANQDAVDADAV